MTLSMARLCKYTLLIKSRGGENNHRTPRVKSHQVPYTPLGAGTNQRHVLMTYHSSAVTTNPHLVTWDWAKLKVNWNNFVQLALYRAPAKSASTCWQCPVQLCTQAFQNNICFLFMLSPFWSGYFKLHKLCIIFCTPVLGNLSLSCTRTCTW